jgi:aspartokinase-like uncharacterized kinase
MTMVRVIKLGGSLLDNPATPKRLPRWLDAQSPARNLLVVGGGRLVDALREKERGGALGTEAAHWLAVRAMRINAGLIQVLLPQAHWVARLAQWLELPSASPQREVELAILDPWEFLQSEESAADLPPLPHRWDVTSDSIAARVAHRCDAQELVLLKSALPAATDVVGAAQSGYVDAHFPLAAAALCVRCVNLADERLEERALIAKGAKSVQSQS